MGGNENGKPPKGGGKRVFKNSLHEKLLAWKNGTDISAVGEVSGIPETAWCGGGDIVSFPSTLSPAERRIAHQLCLRLDLFHASSGEGENRYVTVSKSGDFESIKQSSTIDHQTSNYCIWYDERSVKPIVKQRYFFLTDTEKQGLQRTLLTAVGTVNEGVSVSLSSEFLIDFEMANLSHMSHMNAKWDVIGGMNRSDAECEQDMDKPHVLVESIEGLQRAAAALSACAEVAFDLEMHSYRTYHGLTCLIQLSGGGVNYIVDPLAPSLWDLISPLLGPIFANPHIVKIGHGIMGGDIPALYRDFGIIVVNAFDTQEASGFLGRTGVGLAALLDLWGCPLRREIATLKDHMKNCDWRFRPLTDVMLRYATLDVHYLVSLYKLQVRELLLSSVSCAGKAIRAGSQGQDQGLESGSGSQQDKSSNNQHRHQHQHQHRHHHKHKNNSVSVSMSVSPTPSADNLSPKGNDACSSSDKDSIKMSSNASNSEEGTVRGSDKSVTKGEAKETAVERENEGEEGDECGGTAVTADSLLVHQMLDKKPSDTTNGGDFDDEDEEGQEVWGLDPAPDVGVNGKCKANYHLSDRFDDEGEAEGGDDDMGDEGGEISAARFLDEDDIMEGGEGDDDDDLWDGWGEEITALPPTPAQNAAADLAAELEVCFAAISSSGKLQITAKKEARNVKSNNKKSSKNADQEGTGSNTGVKAPSSRAQQQQRRKEMKAIKLEKEKAKKLEDMNSRGLCVGTETAVREEVHTEETLSALDEYDEIYEDEGEDEEEGEKEEDLERQDKSVRVAYDDAVQVERRLRGQGVLRAIVAEYSTSRTFPSTISTSVPPNPVFTTTLTAANLQEDPRLSELLGALSSSQQCCLKLWVPKKTSENAYTKVSGFSQRKKTRIGGGQWEAKHVFVFRRLFLWREKEAEKRDESPSYICRGSLLLDAAEFLPTTIPALMKLQTPLPASMRPAENSTEAGAGGEVNLVSAVCDALSVWEVVVKKQVSSPFAEKDDDAPPSQHVKKINSTWKIAEKNAALSAAGLGNDETPGLGTVENVKENENVKNIPEMENLQNIPEKESVENIPEKDNVKNIPEKENVKNIPEKENVKNIPEKENVQNVMNSTGITEVAAKSEKTFRNQKRNSLATAASQPAFISSTGLLLLTTVISIGAFLVFRFRNK